MGHGAQMPNVNLYRVNEFILSLKIPLPSLIITQDSMKEITITKTLH